MEEFKGKVAVVTGGAQGIGAAIARRMCELGMNVALVDIHEAALQDQAERLGKDHPDSKIATFKADVTDAKAVEALAQAVYERFGAVHVLVNNAGIGLGGTLWGAPENHWTRQFEVNVYGVGNGIRAFVPRMIEGGEEGRVINTASMAGLTTSPNLGVYHGTKFAVVGISEALAQELQLIGSKIRVSVLCPGFVHTGILENSLAEGESHEAEGPFAAFLEMLANGINTGAAPSDMADLVEEGLRKDRFWLHPEAALPAIEARFELIRSGGYPGLPDLEAIGRPD